MLLIFLSANYFQAVGMNLSVLSCEHRRTFQVLGVILPSLHERLIFLLQMWGKFLSCELLFPFFVIFFLRIQRCIFYCVNTGKWLSEHFLISICAQWNFKRRHFIELLVILTIFFAKTRVFLLRSRDWVSAMFSSRARFIFSLLHILKNE